MIKCNVNKIKTYSKGDWGLNFTPVLLHIYINFMEKEPSTKFHGVLVIFSRSCEVPKLWIQRKWPYPTNVRNISTLNFWLIFFNFMKKKPPTECYGVFDHFSRSYKVMKFRMTRWCFNVSDVKCGIYLNFWNFLLRWFCFMITMDYFKQNMS